MARREIRRKKELLKQRRARVEGETEKTED